MQGREESARSHITVAGHVALVDRTRIHVAAGLGGSWVVPIGTIHCPHFEDLLRRFPLVRKDFWKGARLAFGISGQIHKGQELPLVVFEQHQLDLRTGAYAIFPVAQGDVYLINYQAPRGGSIWLPDFEGIGVRKIADELPSNVQPLFPRLR